jgi:Ca2+-binding RTX toxin-like protein
LGGEANNSFTGNSSDEIFVSGSGNDILQGKGGMDVFHAGFLNTLYACITDFG